MPFTRLFGQSPTGLGATGEGEMKQWHEKVKQNQERKLRNPLQRLFAVMSMSSLGKPLPDDFGFEFRNLQEMSEKEKSEIAKSTVEAVTAAVDANLIKISDGMKELKASAPNTGMFGGITDEAIAEAEEQEKNAPPPGEMDLPDMSSLTGDSGSAVSWLKRFRKKK
jgi:hypothetical protein